MKDRVPLHPGRVKLAPVSGQANTYDMVRADQPTQEGTPLNKAALFNSNAEQAVFGDAAGNHTPAEAFTRVGNRLDAIEAVGTIRASVRADLGDKWLLCNGEQISKEEYPELFDVLAADISKQIFLKKNILIDNNTSAQKNDRCAYISCITYAD